MKGLRLIARTLLLGAVGIAAYSGGFDDTQDMETLQSTRVEPVEVHVARLLESQVREHPECQSITTWRQGDIPRAMLAHTGKAPNANVVRVVPFTMETDLHVLAWCK